VSIVLFGCGSRMIVDVEESCARLGLEITAIVKNVEGPDYALSRGRVMKVDNIDPAIKCCQYSFRFSRPETVFPLTKTPARVASRSGYDYRPDRGGREIGEDRLWDIRQHRRRDRRSREDRRIRFHQPGCQYWTSRRCRRFCVNWSWRDRLRKCTAGARGRCRCRRNHLGKRQGWPQFCRCGGCRCERIGCGSVSGCGQSSPDH
jgi:hypothetical protein